MAMATTEISFYHNLAQSALEQYDLSQKDCHFLGHSGNVTFRIEAQTGKFLLRIHQAISDAQSEIWQRADLIESELIWLDELHQKTKIAVQKPVKTRQDQWVTQVSVNQTVVNCSILEWIEGELLDSEPTSEQAYQLGFLMAQLHQHSQQWQPPQNFIRPSYDRTRLQAALSNLQSAIAQELISIEHFVRLGNAVAQIESRIPALLAQTPETWGLIHADLHSGNYLLHNEEFRPIDFALCGFGYYLYDVASALQYLSPTTRSNFFEGYQSLQNLPEHYLPITESFFIMAVLDVMAFHVSNPLEHEWLAETVKDVADHHIASYLEGKSFLFDRY